MNSDDVAAERSGFVLEYGPDGYGYIVDELSGRAFAFTGNLIKNRSSRDLEGATVTFELDQREVVRSVTLR